MPKKATFYTIFIACEGENTEPNYFGRIVESIDEERRIRVTVYPKPKFVAKNDEDKNDRRRSDPIGLVEEARRQLSEGFDEAWAVFDKDGHTGHAEAFQNADKEIDGKRVNIAFSSIAFEHWILLHFEQNRTSFQKSKDLIEGHFLETGRGLLKSYSKLKETDIYPELKGRTLIAIENTAWLRQQVADVLQNENGNIYQVNPYTNVDELVKILLDIPYYFTWGNFNEDVVFRGYIVNISIIKDGFSVTLTNNTSKALVLNKNNISDFFFIHNSVITLQIAQTLELEPNSKVCFTLTHPASLPSDQRLVFQIEKNRLIIS